MASVYSINKGVGAPVEFRGLKAQYIWFLGGGLVALLVLFAILYVCGISPYLCIAVVFGAGGTLFSRVYKLSRKYGQYGMMKRAARRMLPKAVRNGSRRTFYFEKAGKGY